jgi:hypothetical protein
VKCRHGRSRGHVHVDGPRLIGKAWGERVNPDKHNWGVEIKGATTNDLLVNQNADGTWLAQRTVDVQPSRIGGREPDAVGQTDSRGNAKERST